MPYIPDTSFNYAAPGGQLDVLRNMTPQQLLNMRTQDRIAQGAPALAENARQFNVGTAENARQFNLTNMLQGAQLEAQIKQAADRLGFDYANMNAQQRQAAEALAEQGREFNVSDVFRNRQLTSQEQQALQQLQEQARQFNVGNQSANEQFFANLGERARESDIGTQLSYDQLSSQQLLNQLNAWLNYMSGIH